MKTLLNIICLIPLATLASGQVTKPVMQTTRGNSAIKHYVQSKDNLDFHIDTVQLNNRQYLQVFKDKRFNCLVSVRGDTIVKPESQYFKAEFLDIDEDGYKDIRVFTFSNTPNQCDNYLFDKSLKTFKLIEDCELDIKKLKGTQFYYSYNRTGCADMNWESHLSKIEHYKLVDYGYIDGHGCNENIKEPQVIEIYKIPQETLIKQF